jgi:hypothetical protein
VTAVGADVRFDEDDLVQDLSIFEVSIDGDDVSVAVYGGREQICGSVRFTFRDPEERASHVERLLRWKRHEALVSLLQAGDRVSLFREDALFAQLDGDLGTGHDRGRTV